MGKTMTDTLSAPEALFEPGHAVTLPFTVTEGMMEAFRTVSGDDNPLHDDKDFAAARGFKGPVVYGGLLVAQVSRLLGTRLPGHGCVWQSLNLRFRQPLHVGEAAEVTGTVIHGNADVGVVRLALAITSGGRKLAEGEAQALLPRGRA